MFYVFSITTSFIMANLVSMTNVASAFRNLKLSNLKVHSLNDLKTHV